MFIVGLVPWTAGAVQNKNKTRSIFCITSNAAGCLNIFRCGFGLSSHGHQTKSGYIQANGNHVCGKANINRMLLDFPFGIHFAGISNSQICQAGSYFAAGDTTGKFLIPPNVSSVLSVLFFCRIPLVFEATLIHNVQMLIDVRPNPSGCLSKFTNTIIVTHIGPVGITIRFRVNPHRFGTIQQRCKQADCGSCIGRRSCSQYAYITPTILITLFLCKERVSCIEARGGKLKNLIPVTAVQSVALFFCTADSCSRSNNLWMNIAGCCSCGTEFVNQCFIVAYHGTQRARNQMQLVLNNKIRRSLLYPVFITEYFLRIRAERKHCKLIHGTQQQCRGLFINRFIHDKQRQILGRKVALTITTPESKAKLSPAQRYFPVTGKFPLIFSLLYRPHLCTTPRAFQHNKRIVTFSAIQLFIRFYCIAHFVGSS